nr:NS2 [Guangxi orbivirus]
MMQTENKKDGLPEKTPRLPIRTATFYCTTGNTFIGKVSKALGTTYVVVKVGMSTHIQGVNAPPPRSSVITISTPCAIKLVDREATVYFMISDNGIEARIGRWPRYKFETVDTSARFCKIQIGSEVVEESLRVGKAVGMVPPYTDEEVAEIGEDLDLPGVSFMNVESSNVGEYRNKLREQRDVRRDVIGAALKEMGAARSEGVLFGMRPEVTAKLQPTKKIVSRVQGKNDDAKPKGQRTPKVLSPTGSQLSLNVNPFTFKEPESDDASEIARMLRGKLIIEPKSQATVEDMSVSSPSLLAERMRSPSLSSVMSVQLEQKSEVGKPKIMEICSPVQKIITSPTSSGFKLSDEYCNLSLAIHSDENLAPELAALELGQPMKLGAFERIVSTFSFQKVGVLPIFNINQSTCEYSFAGYENVNKAVLVISDGMLIILPVF